MATGDRARAIVTPPPVGAPRYGLLASVPVADDSGNPAGTSPEGTPAGQPDAQIGPWERGFSYTPEHLAGVGGVRDVNCDGTTDAMSVEEGAEQLDWDPFVVWDGDRCSTFVHSSHSYEERARRALLAHQSFYVARELWAGALAQADVGDGVERAWLLGEAEVVGTGLGVDQAVARLEGKYAACSKGQRGMIAIPVGAYATLKLVPGDGGYINAQGGVLTTQLGTLVVPDPGFGAGAPQGQNATNLWVTISPVPRVRLDAVQVWPGSLDTAEAWAQTVNRSRNDVTVIAQRLVAYDFDVACTFAAGTNLTASQLT